MRIAVFADNHANPYSTRTVLKAISDAGLFDAVVAAGDVCSGGPWACSLHLRAIGAGNSPGERLTVQF